MLKQISWYGVVAICLIVSNLTGYWLGKRQRMFSDGQLIEYGYSIGWNQALSMTEIPGAEIIDLSTGTKRIVPKE